MEDVTYLSSGALNRAHFALVSKQEQGGRNDEAVWETYSAIRARMSRPSSAGIAASIGGFLNVAGLRLQLPASGWNSRLAREDLLLLLYCRQSLEGGSRKLSVNELLFALPAALTLAEAGQTMEERRIGVQGYLFCAEVLPSDHEMQLLIVNTIRKDIESSNTARIILALDAVIASPNVDVIPAIRQRLEVLSAHRSPHVRRRVLHAYRVLSPLDPDILQDCKENLLLRLRDDSSMVKSAALALLQTCFQNGLYDLPFILSILTEMIRPAKGKKHSLRSNPLGVLTIRAVEALGTMAPEITEGIEGVFNNVLMLAARAAAHRSWGVLIACMRTISRFSEATITSRLMQAVDNSQPSIHPLSFLCPLLRSTDINVISVLLQSLAVLPVQTWAGGPVMLDTAERSVRPSDTAKKAAQAALSPLADIEEAELFGEEAELFGEEVEQGVWRKAGEPNPPLQVEATFPALFTEAEVGVIVGLLRSRDEAIRKLTLTILARSDSSSDGIVNQYLGQLVSAVSTAATPDTETSEDVLRRNSLVCQALQVAEVLSGDDGEAYATSATEIILKADNQRTRGVGVASPTLSSRSRTSTDTKTSGKGRGGTMEKAIEMILTRARRASAFSTQFSSRIVQILLNLREDEQLSITFLVIIAAVICEKEELGGDVAQQLLERFSHYLPLTSPSIQETILLVMLRLVACLDRVPDEVVTAVEDLRHRSGRHIHHRCLQFMNQIANLPALTKTVKETEPLNISALLRVLEAPSSSPPSEKPHTESSKPSTFYEESLLGLRTSNVNRELRYQAYETPTRAKQGASRHRDMRTELLNKRIPHPLEGIQGRRGDASDLIELASAINISESTARGESSKSAGNPYLTEANLTHLVQNMDSPFETSISTVLSEIQPPPFLSRTKSPINSPPLSPGRFQRSPPLSPRMNTPTRGSPSSRLGKLNPHVDIQDAEVSFDIRFDRLGTQARTTARGWFDGSMDNVVDKLRILQYVETSVVYRNGDDAKVQLKQGTQLGLLKLRQEEDHSTLWILRCSDTLLQKDIKEALL